MTKMRIILLLLAALISSDRVAVAAPTDFPTHRKFESPPVNDGTCVVHHEYEIQSCSGSVYVPSYDPKTGECERTEQGLCKFVERTFTDYPYQRNSKWWQVGCVGENEICDSHQEPPLVGEDKLSCVSFDPKLLKSKTTKKSCRQCPNGMRPDSSKTKCEKVEPPKKRPKLTDEIRDIFADE